MSEKTTNQTTEFINPVVEQARRPGRVVRRVIGAVATVAVALGGAGYVQKQQEVKSDKIAALQTELERTKRIVGALEEVDPNIVSGKALQSPAELPHYGSAVTREQHAKLQASTVKIGASKPGAAELYGWDQTCTGTKVSHEGATFVLSAAHCFEGDVVPANGAFNAPARAINIAGQASQEYAILDAAIPGIQRGISEPLGHVTGVAVDQSKTTDMALLSVSGEGFDALPAINLGLIQATGQWPYPSAHELKPNQRLYIPGNAGQQTAQYGIPDIGNNNTVSATGRYLGRTPGDGAPTANIDLVGTSAARAEADPCQFGASGSSTLMADGTLSGPLSYRNSIGYGVNHEFVRDSSEQDHMERRLRTESATGTNLDEFSVICGYTVPIAGQTIPELLQVLEQPELVVYESSMK